MNRRMDQIENELRKMKKELTLATDAEEKSRKALDDLAAVLREVSSAASEAKEKVKSLEAELKAANAENEQLKINLRSTNERLSSVTIESNKRKNEVERLRMEADETLAAWNEKESGLVGCMRNVEEERTRAQVKNSALQDEMRKLRDILKQAMAEAVGAKECASLVKAENSQLKEMLAEKDTTLNFVLRELESLRNSNNQNVVQCLPEAVENEKECKKVGRAFSFDMRCTGKNRRFEDLVDEKAMVKGGSSLKRVERQHSGRHRIDGVQDSLRKKPLAKRVGELLGSRNSSK